MDPVVDANGQPLSADVNTPGRVEIPTPQRAPLEAPGVRGSIVEAPGMRTTQPGTVEVTHPALVVGGSGLIRPPNDCAFVFACHCGAEMVIYQTQQTTFELRMSLADPGNVNHTYIRMECHRCRAVQFLLFKRL